MNRRMFPVFMEQIFMILVFSMVCAVCLRLFLFSDRLSRENEALTEAVLLSQNTAERLKSSGGKIDAVLGDSWYRTAEDNWVIYYDEKWNVTEDADRYCYELKIGSRSTLPEGLEGVLIAVLQADTQAVLFQIPVCWQEDRHE